MPDRMAELIATIDATQNARIECQIECPKMCQKECQNRCQIEYQKEYHLECQRKCQNRCQKGCQNECVKRCQIECQNRTSDTLPEVKQYMPYILQEMRYPKLWQNFVTVGIARSKVICRWNPPAAPSAWLSAPRWRSTAKPGSPPRFKDETFGIQLFHRHTWLKMWIKLLIRLIHDGKVAT